MYILNMYILNIEPINLLIGVTTTSRVNGGELGKCPDVTEHLYVLVDFMVDTIDDFKVSLVV